MVEDDEIDWDNYETGPFCRHYNDPSDCDEPCARCGHKCSEHGGGWDNNEPCEHDGCACPGFVDPV